MKVRLGKLPPKHDPRTLQLAKYLNPLQVKIPESVDYTRKVGVFPMYRNDEIGLCAIATLAHLRQVWTGNDDELVTPTVESVLDGYRTVGGWDGVPGSPSDGGCMMLDVLRQWRNVGLVGSRIAAYAKVDHTNLDLVKAGIHRFGGVLLGVSLPAAVQDQTNDQPWLAPARGYLFGQWAPGSWGGHAIIACGYEEGRFKCVTWGGVKEMSENFFAQYVDECYVGLAKDWTGADAKAPSGFDAMQLSKDLGLLK